MTQQTLKQYAQLLPIKQGGSNTSDKTQRKEV